MNHKTKLKAKITKKKTKLNNNYNLKGGEKLGEGGYGCVVRPAIPCSSLSKKNIHNKISKIILNYKPKEYKEELAKLSFIKKIDPENIYCISYLEECELDTKQALKHRIKDIIKVHYDDYKSDSDQFTIENTAVKSPYSNEQKTAIKRDYCLLDPKQPYEYRNQIQVYGGRKIKPILKNINNRHIINFNFIKKNYIHIFKHLLLGLKLMHKNKFVHRDIKLDNMVYTINDKNNLPYFKYIDFGLSDNLNVSQTLYLSGTPGYIPIDFILFFEMAVYHNSNYNLKDDSVRHKILSYIIVKYAENVNFIVTSYNSGIIKRVLEKPLELKTINGQKILKHKYKKSKNPKLDYLMISNTQLESLYKRFLPYIDKKDKSYNELLFTQYTGLIYKTDIFALGVVFGMILNYINVKNAKMLSLIKNMMHYDSSIRPTINDVLDNDIFKK